MVFLGNPEYGVELQPIDFVKFAEACGGVGFRCERPEEVRPALAAAFASKKPALVEAVVDPFEPPHARPGHAQAGAAPRRGLARGEPHRGKIAIDALPRQGEGMVLSEVGRDRVHHVRRSRIDARVQDVARRARRSIAIDVSAYKVPTDAPESDGTLPGTRRRSSSSRRRPAARPASATPMPTRRPRALIRDMLAEVVTGRDAMAVPGAWSAMVAAIRNLGRPGIASMAISAVDAALWDLKGRCSACRSSTLLGAVRDAAPVYGSGGFTSYSIEQLQEQLGGWVAAGIPRVKMKIGTRPGGRPRPRPGRPRGDRARRRAVRRRQRRLQPQAGPGAWPSGSPSSA